MRTGAGELWKQESVVVYLVAIDRHRRPKPRIQAEAKRSSAISKKSASFDSPICDPYLIIDTKVERCRFSVKLAWRRIASHCVCVRRSFFQ